MNNNELIDSIGRINDSFIDEADEANLRAERKTANHFSIKRLVPIGVAAAILLGLAITVTAYSDHILEAIFKRKTELIDSVSVIIENASDSAEGLTVTVDSAARKISDDLIFLHFTNDDGAFDKGINIGRYEVYINPSDASQTNLEVGKWHMWADYSETDCIGVMIEKIGYDKNVPVSRVDYKLSLNLISGRYRIVFSEIVTDSGEVVCTAPLTVEFDIDIKNMPLVEYSHNKDMKNLFEIDGVEYSIDSVTFEPYSLSIQIKNTGNDLFEYGGEEYYSISKFSDREWMTKRFYDLWLEQIRLHDRYDNKVFKDKKLSDKMHELGDEQLMEYERSYKYITTSYALGRYEDGLYDIVADQTAMDISYDIRVELKADCGAEVRKTELQSDYYDSYGYIDPDSKNSDVCVAIKKMFGFTDPIYSSDIERIYVIKYGDPDFELTVYDSETDDWLWN